MNLVEIICDDETKKITIDGVDISGSVVAITAYFEQYSTPRLVITMDARHVNVQTVDRLVDLRAEARPEQAFRRLVKKKAAAELRKGRTKRNRPW